MMRTATLAMMRHLVIAAWLAAAQPAIEAVQIAGPPADLQAAVTSLTRSAEALPAPSRTTRLTAAIQWLRNNVAKTPADSVMPDYTRSLERAAALLVAQPGAAALDDVTRDLELKVEHCRRLGVGMGGSVLLHVNTRRGATIVGGWQVLYLLKFDEWLKTPPRNFLRVSSPTQIGVEPGRYWIWARDPATGASGERILVEVAGQQELIIDLPVP